MSSTPPPIAEEIFLYALSNDPRLNHSSLSFCDSSYNLAHSNRGQACKATLGEVTMLLKQWRTGNRAAERYRSVW